MAMFCNIGVTLSNPQHFSPKRWSPLKSWSGAAKAMAPSGVSRDLMSLNQTLPGIEPTLK